VAQNKKIVITGSQREDVDPQAVARVIIQLARVWLDDGAISPLGDREDMAHGTAPALKRPSPSEEDLA
jgi:hypothetical protein